MILHRALCLACLLGVTAATFDGAIAADEAAATFRISGQCFDADEKPLAGAPVRLYANARRSDPPVQVSQVISGPDGRFEFPAVVPPFEDEQSGKRRSYNIVANSPDLASATWSIMQQQDAFAKLTLRKPVTLDGRVTNEDGNPVAGATVFGRATNVPGAFTATTDEDGNYAIRDLPTPTPSPMLTLGAGVTMGRPTHFFRVEHPDYGRQMASYTGLPSTVNVTLLTPAVVEGRVIDKVTGMPAADVSVSAQSTNSSQHRYNYVEITTDAEGRYRLLLMPDTYNIWATAPDRTMIALDSFDAKKGNNAPPDLELIGGAIIDGKVVDAEGNPAKGGMGMRALRIGLRGPSRPLSGAATDSRPLGADGTFRLRVPPGENYPFVQNAAADRDQRNAEQQDPIVAKEGETYSLVIRLKPPQ